MIVDVERETKQLRSKMKVPIRNAVVIKKKNSSAVYA